LPNHMMGRLSHPVVSLGLPTQLPQASFPTRRAWKIQVNGGQCILFSVVFTPPPPHPPCGVPGPTHSAATGLLPHQEGLEDSGQRTGPMYFIFCRLYPSFPQPSRVRVLPVISLLLTNNLIKKRLATFPSPAGMSLTKLSHVGYLILRCIASPVRACLIIWWERFRGT
jgi:hypothetical protein